MERKLVFYGAISVDGYIARKNHSLDWLLGTEGEEESGYEEFYETVDTVIMGRKTYDQILIGMPDDFPYAGKECYVFSRNRKGNDDHVEFINEELVGFVKGLKKQEGKKIWVVGGGEILHPLLQEKMVDEFFIQIAPSIIGSGIPLFIQGTKENELKLENVRQFKQLAELHYLLK